MSVWMEVWVWMSLNVWMEVWRFVLTCVCVHGCVAGDSTGLEGGRGGGGGSDQSGGGQAQEVRPGVQV